MRRRWWWIIGGAALAAVIIAVLAVILSPRASPDEVARRYLEALAAGDLAAVESTGIELSEAAASAFGAADALIDDVAIEETKVQGRSAEVNVSYSLSGEQQKSTLTLSETADGWVPQEASALGSVTFDAPVQVGEASLPGEKGVSLLPAVYTVHAAPTKFLDGDANVEILPGSAQDATVDAAVRPEAVDAAQTQLEEYLAECAKPGVQVPPACAIVIPWAADFSGVSEIRYRIDEAPHVSLSTTSFEAQDGVLVATVTGTAADGSTKTLTYRTSEWSVRGDVAFTADDIVLSVW